FSFDHGDVWHNGIFPRIRGAIEIDIGTNGTDLISQEPFQDGDQRVNESTMNDTITHQILLSGVRVVVAFYGLFYLFAHNVLLSPVEPFAQSCLPHRLFY